MKNSKHSSGVNKSKQKESKDFVKGSKKLGRILLRKYLEQGTTAKTVGTGARSQKKKRRGLKVNADVNKVKLEKFPPLPLAHPIMVDIPIDIDLLPFHVMYKKQLPFVELHSHDSINSPSHYKNQVPGIECIDVVQHFNFNRGNIIKYAWRCGDKGNPIEDLKKVIKYAEFEIQRLGKEAVRNVKAGKIPIQPE